VKRTARVIVASAGTIAVTLGAAIFAIEQALALGFQGIDDANIFLRYARNLVEGHGFSYNPESGGVQGFTSELWLVFCAYAELFGEHRSTALVIASVALIAAAFVTVVLVSSRALRRVGAARSATGITLGVAVAVLATHPAWFAWHVGRARIVSPGSERSGPGPHLGSDASRVVSPGRSRVDGPARRERGVSR
jgi:hypothetical protein